MIAFETQSFTRRSPTKTVDAERRLLGDSLANRVRQQLIVTLRSKLFSLDVTAEMAAVYPFLKDKSQVLKDLIRLFKIELFEDRKKRTATTVLQISKKKLDEYGYPRELIRIFEYGTQFIPPLAPIRSMMTGLPRVMKLGIQSVVVKCESL